ncbi:MAG: 50S ribosomal protein L24 [Anaerolineae bacterium]|jgi:large subunit ribosomal protein L24|nr:50S ribosomal protein L24 [Anaerolineae bacterium]
MKVKIRKGDTVEVINGRRDDKGKRGEVIKVLPETNRVVVQGVHMVAKHQRQVQAQGRTVNPGMVRFEGSIALSNVMLVCPKCNKLTRVGLSRGGESLQRICKKCDSVIDG